MFDPDAMRRRFHDLGKSREELVAKAAPLRQERDALIAQIQQLEAKRRELDEKIVAITSPLFMMDQERAGIVRFLGGKTGLS